MGLIRLLIFALAAWVAWRMIRNYRVKQARLRRRGDQAKALEKDKMVKCEYCSVHLPQAGAIGDGGLWFCKPAHRDAYLSGSDGGGEAS